MKWSLRRQAMDSQVLAQAGDETALSDIRAYVASRKKTKTRNRWKRKIRTMKRLLTSAAAIVVAVTLVGCKSASPLSVSLATSTIVSYGLRNSPETAGYLRAVQPVVCAVATGTNLTPVDIYEAIELSGIETGTPEALAIANGVLLIYIAAYDSLGSETNTASVSPYAKAVFCDGFAMGLGAAPMTLARNAPPKTVWPLLKR